MFCCSQFFLSRLRSIKELLNSLFVVTRDKTSTDEMSQALAIQK